MIVTNQEWREEVKHICEEYGLKKQRTGNMKNNRALMLLITCHVKEQERDNEQFSSKLDAIIVSLKISTKGQEIDQIKEQNCSRF